VEKINMNPNTNSATEVKIQNFSLSYGNTEVLNNINLTIKPGELFSLLGPSGSGKSTLLRSIAGFGPTAKGQIFFDSDDVTLSPPWKRDVGLVFQSYALWPHLTVWQNVAFGLKERKMTKSQIAERVKNALELVELSSLADRNPNQLSGGQQQRVALARTIVIEPRVLLLDEPLSNLDVKLRISMRREILQLQRKLGITTIFVTHDQEEANTISDRIAVIDQGIIQQVGPPIELYDRPINQFVARFLGTANIIEGQLEKNNESIYFHTTNNLTIPNHINNNANPNHTNNKAKYAILRPQNLKIVASKSVDNEYPDTLTMKGRVLYKEFLGNIIRYTVENSGQHLLIDENHQGDQKIYPEGTEVKVIIKTKHIFLI